jgi:hypothetical protein
MVRSILFYGVTRSRELAADGDAFDLDYLDYH